MSNAIACEGDVGVVSPSAAGLQKMVNTVVAGHKALDLPIKSEKFVWMIFENSSHCEINIDIYLGNEVLNLVSEHTSVDYILDNNL